MKKTPKKVIERFEKIINDLDYGTASITYHVGSGQPRYVISKEESFLEKDVNSENENRSQGAA